jgi:hypothetical protein
MTISAWHGLMFRRPALKGTLFSQWPLRRPRAPDHQGGYDWTRRYPRIVEAALQSRQAHFEAIIRGVVGVRSLQQHAALLRAPRE